MAESKKPTVVLKQQRSCDALQVNLLSDPKMGSESCEEGPLAFPDVFTDSKENNAIFFCGDKENAAPPTNSTPRTGSVSAFSGQQLSLSGVKLKSLSTGRVLKPSSLQSCMQLNEPQRGFKSKIWDPIESENSASSSIWDFSDSETAPASSWSALPNRALLCRPLPLDVGTCTCVILKEALPKGLEGGTLYSLYTNEGRGREDRKLALAHHKRRNGLSEFTVAHNVRGLCSSSDDSFVGNVTANLVGSKYHIWNQAGHLSTKQCNNSLLGVVAFMPTVASWTGSYRRMKVSIPKHHSMQLKNTTQMQHINGLPNDWEAKTDNVHKLCSREPHYNTIRRQYELDFRDRGRAGLRIEGSVKNFQLTFEESGKQTVLQLGRVGKSKFVMDFRSPLTGYQAFCICLASIDSKLCCIV